MEHSFFPPTTPNRLESLRLLSLAETHLATRDLQISKSYATRARDIDPSTLLLANQILAVIDTLLSSDRTIANNQPDLYGILGLSPQQQNDNVLIFKQYENFVQLLENNKYPFADVALRSVVEAYEVLSNPVKKAVYDKELAFYLQQQRLSDPFSFCCLPSMQQNFIYFGGSAAAVNSPFSRGFGVSLGSNVSTNNNNISSSSSSGGNNCVRGFSAFVSSSNLVPVVEGNGTNGDYVDDGGRNGCDVNVDEENQLVENGTQSFMDILGMNNVNNHVQGFSAFVSNHAVPVVEGNGTNGDYSNSGERNDSNQDRVEETNVKYSNVGERKESDVNVVEENQDKLKETNGDYSNADVNVCENEVNVDGVDVEEVVVEEEEEERVEETGEETGNGGVEGTFWTACPYCCCMFEYPGVYVDCCMRCQFCKSAFQGLAIASPPAIVEGEDGKEGYYCCWSFFPVGVSKESWEKCNEGTSGWILFSPMFAEPGLGTKGSGSSGPRVYVDDDEAWMESSESEEFDDVDWNKENTRRQTRVTRTHYKIAKKVQVDKCSEKRKRRTITPTRRQPSRAAKNTGKLDWNVECSSNEAEEPPSKRNMSRGSGEEDNIEGNGFFEGLDEYSSSFPILDGVEGDDMAVKVA